MRITLKLFATLEQYLPAQRQGHNEAVVELAEGSSIGEVLRRLGVPREQVHLVLLDGQHVAAEQLDSTTVPEGASLAVWPPVAGG